MDNTLLRFECLKMAERMAGSNNANEAVVLQLALRLYQWVMAI